MATEKTAEQLARDLRAAADQQGPGCTVVIRTDDVLAAAQALREMTQLLDRIANSAERPGHVAYISKGDIVIAADELLSRDFGAQRQVSA